MSGVDSGERPLLLATRSAGKLRELHPLFARAGIAVTDLAQLGVAETAAEEELERYDTFEENALAKARYFRELTGLPTVADDSGLEVLALGGAPGVRSKRWGGRTDLPGRVLDEVNNAKLLDALRCVTDRRARYVCVAALCDGAGELVRRGEVAGRILDTGRGSGGFGYDPYFLPDEATATFGELTREEKERISHRGRAFAALVSALATRRPA